jgi:hypothetical protein
MEIQSRLNLLHDYRQFAHGPILVQAIRDVARSGATLDHIHVVQIPTLAAGATHLARIVKREFDFLIVDFGIIGSPTSVLRKCRVSLVDATNGQPLIKASYVPVTVDALPKTPPVTIGVVLEQGNPLDLKIENTSSSQLDFAEAVFSGMKY